MFTTKDYSFSLETLLNHSLLHFVANAKESDHDYTVQFELPGYKSSDIELSVEENVLKVKASNARKGTRESFYILASDANVDAISAKMEDGILLITVPKPEKAKPKKIKVN